MKIFYTLLIIFICVIIGLFLGIVITRIAANFALEVFSKNIKPRLPKNKNQKKKFLPKKDDVLSIKKENINSYEKISSNDHHKREIEETKIIDIVQPVGFWTSMILGKKLTYLISSAKLMNKKSGKGFWTSMIEAQTMAAGRERGKGRG